MDFDFLAYSLLAIFALIGALRGAIPTGVSLASIVVSYFAAFWGGPVFADTAVARLGVPGLLGAPIAGACIFVVAYLICGIAGMAARKWDRLRRMGDPRSFADRGVGALFGCARGGLIVLVLAVLVGWLDAARDVSGQAALDVIPQAEDSAMVGLGNSMASEIAALAMADAGASGQVAVAMFENPGRALGNLQSVLEHDAMRELQRDGAFWLLLEQGRVDRAMDQTSFAAIIEDDELRAQFAALGAVSPEAARDPEVFRAYASEALVDAAPRIRELRASPALESLATDPEVASMIESGNTMGLLAHPDVRELASLITAEN
jgi:membrane protein required for colicin V production